MKRFVLCLAVLALAFGSVWRADAVLIDPDAFANGTDITNAFPGITLTTVDLGANTFSVLSLSSGLASTGTQVFGRNNTGPNSVTWGDGIWEYLRIDIAAGATSATLDFIADDASDANAVLAAYDGGGNLLTSAASVGIFSTGQTVSLTVSDPNIATVLALGDPLGSLATIASVTSGGGGRDAWQLDNLNVRPIPEPSTYLLFGIGILAVFGAGYRQRKKAA